MSTQSTNSGGQGGARVGAGRKKTPAKDRLAEGKTLKILDIPEVDTDMPVPAGYLGDKQKRVQLEAREIYANTWNWLKKIGCTSIVFPQLIERYAMCAARWIQCEHIVSKEGLTAAHPTTGNPCTSPYVNIGINYMNQAAKAWNEIYNIIRENCTTEYNVDRPDEDVTERLLSARGL